MRRFGEVWRTEGWRSALRAARKHLIMARHGHVPGAVAALAVPEATPAGQATGSCALTDVWIDLARNNAFHVTSPPATPAAATDRHDRRSQPATMPQVPCRAARRDLGPGGGRLRVRSLRGHSALPGPLAGSDASDALQARAVVACRDVSLRRAPASAAGDL